MKAKQIIFLILAILLIDQGSKFYIKLNYYTGEEHNVLGTWFRLHFVENEGMAWGWKFGGEFGKIALTLFRLVAVIWGSFLIRNFIRQKQHKGFLICAALIYAGALGNLIDSLFYGLIFEASNPFTQNVATFLPAGGGYAGLFHGKVVDMLYFPIITNSQYPSWIPIVGGEEFEFFRPVFNVADMAISTGVIAILIFQNKFFNKHEEAQHNTVETNADVSDKTQIF
ncbi:lipoprotein signal peptidase [Sediminibacterium salmoneum]|uniref:lipoprotein signal peptidase n=1 Tax=Sediminibacterium salmoneum TaxID=426421 RepID=UPI000478FA35|nr:lipoprotein signal peptidase [Sediminibacterium salmoneum]